MEREQSRYDPRKAALRHDATKGLIEVKPSKGPPERFEIVRDGEPLRGWELRRVPCREESSPG